MLRLVEIFVYRISFGFQMNLHVNTNSIVLYLFGMMWNPYEVAHSRRAGTKRAAMFFNTFLKPFLRRLTSEFCQISCQLNDIIFRVFSFIYHPCFRNKFRTYQICKNDAHSWNPSVFDEWYDNLILHHSRLSFRLMRKIICCNCQLRSQGSCGSIRNGKLSLLFR